MTNADKPNPVLNSNETIPPAWRRRRKWAFGFLFVGMLALVTAAGLSIWQTKLVAKLGGMPGTAQTDERFDAIEARLNVLEKKVGDMASAQANASASAAPDVPVAAPGKTPVVSLETVAASTAAIGRMQSDMVALSAAVSGLQAEMKQTGSAVAETQASAQSAVASAIAFMQLRETVAAGRGFAPELATLRRSTGNNPALQEDFAKLDPYAAQGVPTLANLREEFLSLEGPATSAADMAAAETWWQRVWAKLKSLVSVRILHGEGAADAFTNAETALNANDLAGALAALDGLPDASKDALKLWREKAEARQIVDAALHDAGDRFVAPSSSAPLASTPAAPMQDNP